MAHAVDEITPPEGAPTVLQRATEAVRTAAHLSHEARLLKSLTADAVEEGVHAARRTYRITRRRAEDKADEAATYIRRYPLQTVGVALGAGLLLGIAGTWIARACGGRSGDRRP